MSEFNLIKRQDSQQDQSVVGYVRLSDSDVSQKMINVKLETTA